MSNIVTTLFKNISTWINRNSTHQFKKKGNLKKNAKYLKTNLTF